MCFPPSRSISNMLSVWLFPSLLAPMKLHKAVVGSGFPKGCGHGQVMSPARTSRDELWLMGERGGQEPVDPSPLLCLWHFPTSSPTQRYFNWPNECIFQGTSFAILGASTTWHLLVFTSHPFLLHVSFPSLLLPWVCISTSCLPQALFSKESRLSFSLVYFYISKITKCKEYSKCSMHNVCYY